MRIVFQKRTRPITHPGLHARLWPQAFERLKQRRHRQHIAQIIVAQDKDRGGRVGRWPPRRSDRCHSTHHPVAQSSFPAHASILPGTLPPPTSKILTHSLQKLLILRRLRRLKRSVNHPDQIFRRHPVDVGVRLVFALNDPATDFLVLQGMDNLFTLG